MQKPGTFSVYRARTDESGEPDWRLAGRFMISNGNLHILEDYYEFIEQHLGQGPLTPQMVRRINSANASSYIRIEDSKAEGVPEAGSDPHGLLQVNPDEPPLVTVQAPQKPLQRPPVFEYMRAGMEVPHILEIREGKALLDGNELSEIDRQLILGNASSGAATIRYRGSRAEKAIRKMERSFQNLVKEEDMDPASALAQVREAVKAGHLHPDIERALTRHIYEDKMTPGIGNKYAANQFMAKNKPGVIVSMDGNDFKSINDIHGHDAGDAAITSFGNAAREAMDESVGRGQGKVFHNPDEQDLYRNGGDEFVAHVPTHEHAAKFARLLREKLEKVPPINGTHKLSMSFGFGTDPHSADKALYEAKKQKYVSPETKERKWAPGQVPSLAHSAVPGFEGPIPLQPETLPLTAPHQAPEPAKPTAPSLPAAAPKMA